MTIKEYSAKDLAAQPIGWWSGEAYRRVVGAIRAELAVEDLTQPHWWTLNHVSAAPGRWARAELAERLAAYDDQGINLIEVFDDLIARGWVVETDGHLTLTDEGEAGLARARTRGLQAHRQTHEGVSEADYATTVNVLRRMVANLGGNGDLPD